MKDYSTAFGNVELPQQQSSGNSTPRESNIDYDALNKAQVEALGGLGKHSFIAVCTNCYDLGTQKQDEQTIPVDSDDFSNHEWRLEKWEDSGVQKLDYYKCTLPSETKVHFELEE